MHTTRYLIVGGGLTADAACKGIREVDADGGITVVAEDAYPPYSRPALSEALWQGTGESSIWRATERLGVELRLGRRIVALDPTTHRATDEQGEGYAYERRLLAPRGRMERRTSGARSTRTSGCCSPPVDGRARFPSPPTRSSTTGRSTTIVACGRASPRGHASS